MPAKYLSLHAVSPRSDSSMRAHKQHLALGKGLKRKRQKWPSSPTSKQSFTKQKIPGSYILVSKDRFLQRKLKWGEDQRPDRKKQVVAMEDSIIRQINNGVHDPGEGHREACTTSRKVVDFTGNLDRVWGNKGKDVQWESAGISVAQATDGPPGGNIHVHRRESTNEDFYSPLAKGDRGNWL